ncbi:D-isomer specific 2-hydroxyacid dehydrogenase family protein [Amycolatopsis endophytica]|nr:D-isomer specific 2-hydroxyacid dehydrogenase family protein [Amycolatopsis endophytica]
MSLTVFGCCRDEATLFREMGRRLGVRLTITEAAVCEGNAAVARGSRCISVSHKTQITKSTILALSRAGVEYISTRSIGYNHVDVEYAASVGITVGNVDYSPDSVGDYTLMLMLMAVRNAKSIIRRTDAHDYRLDQTRGKELRDMTIGVIGVGKIGTAVIDRLRGFGCRVLAHDSQPHLPGGDSVSLSELFQNSDIVSLHTPLTPRTHHLLNRERIEQMKHGAYVINTGRGPLIDTAALLASLENGHLGGAALDVLEGEEGIFYADWRDKPVENQALLRLQAMPNVLISPHTAYYTDHALADTVENSLVNCMSFERKRTV